MKTLKEILSFLEVTPLPAEQDLVVKGLSQQTQDLEKDWVFIALQGSRSHGLDFIQQAKEQGALTVLSDKPFESDILPVIYIADLAQKTGSLASWFYNFPTKKLKIIGVTGTNGKTSVTSYLAQLIADEATQVGGLGTLGVGIYGQFKPSPNTTPDVFKLQHHLAEFVAQKVTWVVMEVSSHALALERIAGLEFKAVALTQLGQDHLDFHQNLDNYKESKKLLFSSYLAEHKITNLDDSLGKELALEKLANFNYGLQQGDLHAQDVVFSSQGISGKLVYQNKELEFATELFGEFNLENILCSLAVLLALGWEFNQELINKLNNLKPVAGRMQLVKSTKDQQVIIDYAHTADALEKLLLTIKAHNLSGKIWLVFGCGGDRDKTKRPLMGEVANRLADRVILTSDNPRYEDPQKILDEIALAVPSALQILDRKEALEIALTEAQTEDLIVIAGKGHEEFQEVAGKRLPFSDLQVVQAWQA